MMYRSLRQLKKEVATKMAQTAKAKVRADSALAAPSLMPAGLDENQADMDLSPGLDKTYCDEYYEVTQ